MGSFLFKVKIVMLKKMIPDILESFSCQLAIGKNNTLRIYHPAHFLLSLSNTYRLDSLHGKVFRSSSILAALMNIKSS